MKLRHGLLSIFPLLLSLFLLGCVTSCGGSKTIGTCTGGNCPCTSCGPTKYVAVSDANNDRVLIFDEPLSTGENASVVLGQTNFTQAGSGSGQSGMSTEGGLAFDPSGNLYVADIGNNRVLQFVPPFSNGMNASLVFGQNNFNGGSPSSSSSKLDFPLGIAIDANGNLWVTDAYNSRVLEYTKPFTSGMAASVAIGQSSTSGSSGCNGRGTGPMINPTASTLCYPIAVAFDASANLWVADEQNSRVLEYTPPFSTGMAATLELGHAAGANAFSVYMGNDGAVAPAANTFLNPAGLAFDAHGNVWVADFSNNRVLEFVPPFSNGLAATLVLGEPDFAHNTQQPASQSSLQPSGVAFDTNGNLLVADSYNSRVMVFSPPFSDNLNASMVLGQQNFTSFSSSIIAANTLNSSFGVATF